MDFLRILDSFGARASASGNCHGDIKTKPPDLPEVLFKVRSPTGVKISQLTALRIYTFPYFDSKLYLGPLPGLAVT